MKTIRVEPLSATAFAPFGNVIEIDQSAENYSINAGTTQRFHDLATVTVSGNNARPIISMARAEPFSLPL
ncbi:MAG: ureidoglycolate lyase, partial [Devosiaceae bacterium]|nr:ureidoglycolate lyase [Devosiaceae bacterium]